MSRNYYIKLNLDAMAADLDSLVTDRERLDWLAGFRVGARGRSIPEWTGALRMGCDFGLAAWNEAQTYRASRAAGGRAKAMKSASNREQPTSNIQQPEMHSTCNAHAVHMQECKVADAPKRFKAPSVEDVTRYCQEQGYTLDAEKFCLYYESNGWKVGKNPMKNWQAAVRTWVKNDQTRTAEKGPQCPYPAGSYAAMDWWVLNSAIGDIK